VFCVVCGEQSLRGAEPPGLGHEFGHLIEVNLAESYQDCRVTPVMGRDEELARLGFDQFVAFLEVGAADEQRIR
jgi:hypothetical protein